MSLNKLELQKILRKYGLSDDGKRPDLMARLKDHLSTAEEEEEEGEDEERLDILEAQFNELRIQQEEHTRILEEIREKVIVDSPPPTDDDERSDLLSSAPSTGNDFMNNNNNNAPPPMPPKETAVKRMQRQKSMSKISALPPERGLRETESEEET